NVCGIEAGYNGPGSKTVIPREASGKIDFRLVPDQDPDKIATLLRAHLDRHGFADVEFSAEEGEHPYRGSADAPLVRAVAAVAEEAFRRPAVLVPSSGGTSPMWVVCNPRRMANVTLGMGHPGARASTVRSRRGSPAARGKTRGASCGARRHGGYPRLRR